MREQPVLDGPQWTIMLNSTYSLRYLEGEAGWADGFYIDIRTQLTTPQSYGDSQLTRHGPIPPELIGPFIAEHKAMTSRMLVYIMESLKEGKLGDA